MVADRVAGWMGAYPLRAAGAGAALLSAGVLWNALDVQVTTAGVTATRTTLAGLVPFFAAHPAYPVAFVVGLAVFLFARG